MNTELAIGEVARRGWRGAGQIRASSNVFTGTTDKEGIMMRHRAALGVALVAAAGLSACQTATGVEPEVVAADALEARMADGLVFLAMRITPDGHMGALFQGAVVEDDAGCLRLDSPDPATVVWPRGYGFTREDGAVGILDADGTLVGRTGAPFHLGGGEVVTLPEAMGFTQADRELAASRCPGRYWIVAD